MPDFLYVGEPERVYANIPGEVVRGVAYALDADPGDGRWQLITEQAQEASVDAGASSVSEAVDSADSAEEA